MTRPTAQECITALEAAKRTYQKQIKQDNDYGICVAIYASHVTGKTKEKVTTHLLYWVRNMLGQYQLLEVWQRCRGLRTTSGWDHNLRPVRLAWLDWMIEECKKELS